MLVVDIEADPQGALAAAALPGTAVMVYNSAIDSTEDVVCNILARSPNLETLKLLTTIKV